MNTDHSTTSGPVISGPTPAQVDYARAISRRLHQQIPADDITDRRALSNWIGAHLDAFRKAAITARSGGGATSRQVGFAEKIARRKRLQVPVECFHDAELMSGWISRNK
jgi:hypothetical protein